MVPHDCDPQITLSFPGRDDYVIVLTLRALPWGLHVVGDLTVT